MSTITHNQRGYICRSLSRLPSIAAVAFPLVSGAAAAALHNHLRNAGASEGLAADKGLALDASKEVAEGSQEQEDGGGNQTAGARDVADELQGGHDAVGSGAHVVGRDLADDFVKLARGWADSEEQGDLDEQDDEGRRTDKLAMIAEKGRPTYIASAQKMMRMGLKEKMLAIPTAKQMIMERMPILDCQCCSGLVDRRSIELTIVRKCLQSG